MGSYKLLLFAEENTATGFQYQQLKALQEWVFNRLESPGNVLYCNTLGRPLPAAPGEHNARWAQVKYYARHASFHSGEVKAAMGVFLAIWQKGQYEPGEIIFTYETNAGAAAESEAPLQPVYEGDDSALLKEWVTYREHPEDGLLAQAVAYVKTVTPRAATGEERGLEAFVRSIRWQCDDISQEEGMALLVDNVDEMIGHLPLVEIKTQASLLRAALYHAIITGMQQAAAGPEPLTSAWLDQLLMQAGAQENKWYRHAVEQWKKDPVVTTFRAGQFYEIITAARYCRFRSSRATGEHESWQDILHQYIHLEDIGIYFLRKAIYEYLFLATAADPDSFLPGGTLAGMEDGIRYYFENPLPPARDTALEEDIALLALVINARAAGQINLEAGLTETWKNNIADYLDHRLEVVAGVDDQCVLLELKGALIMDGSHPGEEDHSIREAVAIYRQIVPLLPHARMYTMKRLTGILDAVRRTMILLGAAGEGTRQLEALLKETGQGQSPVE